MAKRWQPPPMGPKKSTEDEPEHVRVDEQVVRNVLRVNPNVRNGRTTLQVKKALERGGALGVNASPHEKRKERLTESKLEPSDRDAQHQLAETLDFFLTSKRRELQSELEEIAERRRRLDEEENALHEAMRQKLVDFTSMLDAGALALHGKAALASHRALLSTLGVTATELLDVVKRGKS